MFDVTINEKIAMNDFNFFLIDYILVSIFSSYIYCRPKGNIIIRLLGIFWIILLLSACIPAEPTFMPTYTLYPTYTPFPTLDIKPTKDIYKINKIVSSLAGDWGCEVEVFEHANFDEHLYFTDSGYGESSIDVNDGSGYGEYYSFSWEIIDDPTIVIRWSEDTNPIPYTFIFDNNDHLRLTDPRGKRDCKRIDLSSLRNLPTGEPCIGWKEAGNHIGEYQCIEGVVESIYNSGDAFFINFTSSQASFYAVSFDWAWDKSIIDRCIVVWGTISIYNGRPQVIIENEDDLEPCE
ncbi:MAG: hypothetical protein MUO64_13610 [Anaerolineales bacterium]|nr:hypothetical protein [Anaerolineales bacterium]